MTGRFEDIFSKNEEACVKRSDLKEEKKAERFKLLMEATNKKFKLKERKAALKETGVKIAAYAEDAKMSTLNVDSLDADTRMSVPSVRYQMLQRQKDELTEADADTEVAYAAATTP